MSEISNPKLKGVLESLLFVSKKPLSVEELASVVPVDPMRIRNSLEELMLEYENKGLQIAKIAGGWQMVTVSENSEFVDKLLNSPVITTLSPAALEALAVIAYKQPVTRIEVDNIRGVASDGVVKTLLDKRMIREVGRSDALGRPILYGTTVEFLRHFGLKDLGDLPPLPEGLLEEKREVRERVLLPLEAAAAQASEVNHGS